MSGIDWRVARYVAGRVAGDPTVSGPDSRLVASLCSDAEDRVRAYTLMAGGSRAPSPEVISRAEWVRANTVSIGPLMDAAFEGMGRRVGSPGKGFSTVRRISNAPGTAATAIVTLEVGAVLGILSRRVLGQYDLSLVPKVSDPAARLLFVGPNLEAAARSFGSQGDDFLRWVAIHEVTHAVQFAAVPWLRGYIGALVSDLLASLEDPGPVVRQPFGELARSAARRAGRTVSGRDPFALVLNERQHALVSRLQEAMSVIEGHAEHVMDAAGAEVIPSLPRLRAAMSRRREAPNPVWRLVSRLLGMEMKMRQYEQGKAFCDEVVRVAGPEGLLRVWTAPELLPAGREIVEPQRWLARAM